MGQTYSLVSTYRPSPSMLRTEGDRWVAYGELLPLGFFALLQREDVAVLPWSVERQQLTIFTRKDAALARFERRLPRLASRFATELRTIASKRADHPLTEFALPDVVQVRSQLEQVFERVAAAAGDHLQVYLHSTYVGWDEGSRAALERLLGTGDDVDDGWRAFLEFWGYSNETARPWDADFVEGSLMGLFVSASDPVDPDPLEVGLRDESFAVATLEGAVSFVLARLTAPASLADVLGGIARLLDIDDLVAVTTKGEVHASPTHPDLASLPLGCVKPLGRRSNTWLHRGLGELWQMASDGELTDGPLRCKALRRGAEKKVAPAKKKPTTQRRTTAGRSKRS